MRIDRIGRGVKGFYRLADYALRWGMITTSAQRRLQILGFWQRHGLTATQEAFAISRRTLFSWRAKLRDQGGNLAALAPRSTAPKRRRTRQWPAAITTEIRRLRSEHPNLAKEKLHLLLQPFTARKQLPCPSTRTIGRLIADAPDKMRSRPRTFGASGKAKPVRSPRLRKPKHFTAQRPGHCVSLDSIELRAQNDRRYVITCIDLHSHFAWAWPSIAALRQLLPAALRARLALRQIKAAVLQELAMMAEATQVAAFGEDGHGDHRADARKGFQMHEVGIGRQCLFGTQFEFCPQSVELLVSSQRDAKGLDRQ